MPLSPAQQRIWDTAKALGWDDEAAAVATAVATAEGLGGEVGDSGCSFGSFQLNFCGGQGPAWAASQGFSIEVAKQSLRTNIHAADRWFLENSLGPAINWQRVRGLTGAALAIAAGRDAERPAEGAEIGYGNSFNALFGGSPPSAGAVTSAVATATGAVTNAIGTGGLIEGAKSGIASLKEATGALPDTLGAVASAVQAIPNTLITSVKGLAATLAWLGQVNIWQRLGLTAFGAVLVVVGLVLFALGLSGTDVKTVASLA